METANSGFSHSRTIPLIMLAAVLSLLGFHHWYVLTEHSGYLVVMFLMPPLGMLAIGGLVHPPILYSIGKHGSDLPVSTRMIGIALAISGLGIGFYLFRYVYGF